MSDRLLSRVRKYFENLIYHDDNSAITSRRTFWRNSRSTRIAARSLRKSVTLAESHEVLSTIVVKRKIALRGKAETQSDRPEIFARTQ